MTGHLPPRTSAPRLWLGFRVIGLKPNLDNVFVYVAVIVAKAIARVHRVRLMNADSAPGGRKPTDLAVPPLEQRQQPSAFVIAICYCYSLRKLILFYRPT